MEQLITPNAITYRCPVCGARLSKVYDVDLECWCWVCPDPDCGYIEPIL